MRMVSIMSSQLCFNPCFDGSVARGNCIRQCKLCIMPGFNPCFDGSVARGICSMRLIGCHTLGFNPCFDGSVARGSI